MTMTSDEWAAALDALPPMQRHLCAGLELDQRVTVTLTTGQGITGTVGETPHPALLTLFTGDPDRPKRADWITVNTAFVIAVREVD